MLKCNDCLEQFEDDEVKIVETSYEAYYGVSTLFHNKTPLTLWCCPYCDSDDIDEIEDIEDIEDFEDEEDE